MQIVPRSDWETSNRIGNASNRHQGPYKRVLAVCSAGLLRSPTIAHTLAAEPYNYNTRSAGCVADYALNKVDSVLLNWADEVVCASEEHADHIQSMINELGLAHRSIRIFCLSIPDIYEYRNPQLVEIIKERYNKLVLGVKQENDDATDQN